MSEVLEGPRVEHIDARKLPVRKLAAPQRADAATRLATLLDTRRLFILLPFGLIAGLVLFVQGEEGPATWVLVTLAVALCVGLLLARREPVTFRLLLLAASVCTGLCLLPLHGALFGTPMLAFPAYGTYEARVDEIVSEAESGRRVVISAITPTGEARALPIRRARIVVADGPSLAPGDIVSGAMRFYAVPGPAVPGGYDTQFHAYFDGVGAFGNATGAISIVRSGPDGLERTIDGLRQTMGQRIDAQIEGVANGLARSMMIGDQSRITDEVREVMATSGLAHIYSISGLHLSLVAIGVLTVLRYLLILVPGISRFVSVKKLAAVVALLAAFFYLLLAGGSSNVPAFRSTLMIALVLGAVLAGRRALTMRNVALAALVIILTDPASVFRPSFQLSFAAVVALIGAYEWGRPEGEAHGGALGWLRRAIVGTALTSLIAGLATLLFSAYHFQQTAPLGLVANLMALILIMPIMTAIVLSALLMPLGWEAPVLEALQVLLEALVGIATLVSQWSEGLSLHPLLTPLALLLGLGALAWFAFFEGWVRLAGPALLAPAVMLFAVDRPPDVLVADTTRAVAVRTADGLALVDGKPTSFAVKVWAETYGEPIATAAGRCDSVACIAESPRGFSLALVNDPAGFFEECGRVDLVITRRDAPKTCIAPIVIDAGELEQGGVQWLAWDGARFERRPAKTGVNRPWRAVPR